MLHFLSASLHILVRNSLVFKGHKMTNLNVNQPRTPDGRFSTIPINVPTASPIIIPTVQQIQEINNIEEMYERMQTSLDRNSEEYWANTYHVRFTKFHIKTIEATKHLFTLRPSVLTHSERSNAFKEWVDTISEIYDMESPEFYWDEEADYGGGGYYRPLDHSITMSPNHPSIVTLIHETRHALQHKEKGAPMITEDIERDARAWSLSLYYKVKPNLFKRLVNEGRILHINPSVFNS